MELVSMGEAAQRLSVSVDTIRRRLRRGELQGRHQPTPQGFIWLIEVPELPAPGPFSAYAAGEASSAQANATARPFSVRAGVPSDATASGGDLHALCELVDVLRHEIDTRDRQLEAKDGQLQSKDRQIAQLHLLLRRAHSGSPAPKQPKGRTLATQAERAT